MEQEYIDVNRQAYDKFANQHAERCNKISKGELSDDFWKELLAEQLVKPDIINNVLEIGPGTGRMLKILENDLNCRTVAVELSGEMIKYAREKSPNTIFIEDNILNIKFVDNTYDAIFMGAVIHNFPKKDAEKLLKLVYSWIKPTGKILIYTTIHDKAEEGYYEKSDYNGNIVRFRKKFTEEELKLMLEESKFNIVYKMYDDEPDRNKKWVTYIVEKQ